MEEKFREEGREKQTFWQKVKTFVIEWWDVLVWVFEKHEGGL